MIELEELDFKVDKSQRVLFQPPESVQSSIDEIDLISQSSGTDSISMIIIKEPKKCNICLKPFDNDSEVFTANDNIKCRHKFHKECIKNYLNNRCTKILGIELHCPVSLCRTHISQKSGVLVLDSLNDVFRFESNLYIAKRISRNNEQMNSVEF